MKNITIVAAYDKGRVIGNKGKIPWDSPEDLAHFRQVTQGGTLIMGRKTYESIGFPLPSRRNIVLSRNRSWSAPNVEVATYMTQAFLWTKDEDVFVIGGAEVYNLALGAATHQILTEVDVRSEGDTRFPYFNPEEWNITRSEEHPTAKPALKFTWLERRYS